MVSVDVKQHERRLAMCLRRRNGLQEVVDGPWPSDEVVELRTAFAHLQDVPSRATLVAAAGALTRRAIV